jgi:enamine deaminase RidA (YjgF/YER057c/UK114 family)
MESISCEQTAIQFRVSWAGEGQAFLVVSVRSPVDAVQVTEDSYMRIAGALREHRLEIVHERIFGSLSVEPSVIAARHRAFHIHGLAPDNPITFLQGSPPWGEGFAGTIIHATSTSSADDIWTIRDGKEPCGRGWRRNGVTHLCLQNINAKHNSSVDDENRHGQVQQMLDRAERILRENGASYRDVARTWFYLSDILAWYASFNKVRNEKYGEFGIMPRSGDRDLLLPASTGISGDTHSGSAATMNLIAIVGDAGRRKVKQLTSAAQLDAFRYGSAFSRGALIQAPEVSLIEVSGTAAIDQQGRSQFLGDIRGQISCTLDRIETILGQAGAGLRDVIAATVFVKSPEYVPVFWEMAKDRGLEEFPAVCIVADVCREELLFEIDAEAAVKNGARI